MTPPTLRPPALLSWIVGTAALLSLACTRDPPPSRPELPAPPHEGVAQSWLAAAGAGPEGGDVLILRASAKGEVRERGIDPGERTAPEDAEPACLIGDPKQILINAAFSERDAPLLVADAPCAFSIPALGSSRSHRSRSAARCASASSPSSAT